MTHDTVKDAAVEITQDAPRAPTRLTAVHAVATREMTYPRNGTGSGNGRRFSANQILQWVDTFKTMEGRPPRWRDRSVWNRDNQNKPILIRNVTWRVIDQYIQDGWLYCDGVHARSLNHLLETKGYFAEQRLSAEKLRNWIARFHEKEGKYPSHADKTVWEKDGAWRPVTGESWDAINQSLRQGQRGLDVVPERSLAEFKRAHGFVRQKPQKPQPAPHPEATMTTARVLSWMQLFHAKEGKYPSHLDKSIWERDAKGAWVAVKGKSWSGVNMWLRKGHADGPAQGIRSLAELKSKLGVPSKRGRQVPAPGKIMLQL
ncbi:MAG: hypothetical protein KBA75_07320 [Alphaproteobacteria bacterium]|nr:hypothetical protein [Alphaproteobacteria bacterium]